MHKENPADVARRFLGADYGEGGGQFVCSTLVVKVARLLEVQEGSLDPSPYGTTAKKMSAHLLLTKPKSLARGALVFFTPAEHGMNPEEFHVAIADGARSVVHACPVCLKVTVDDVLKHKARWKTLGMAAFPEK